MSLLTPFYSTKKIKASLVGGDRVFQMAISPVWYINSRPSKKFLIRSWLRLLKNLSRSYFNSRSWWKGFKRFQNLDQDLILIILHKILFGEVSKSWWIIKIFTRSLKDLNKNSNFLDKILLKMHFKNFLLGGVTIQTWTTKPGHLTHTCVVRSSSIHRCITLAALHWVLEKARWAVSLQSVNPTHWLDIQSVTLMTGLILTCTLF